MLTATTRGLACSLMWLALTGGAAYAQQVNPLDQAIDAARARADFGPGDQDRIRRWVQHEVDRFTAFNALRDRFRTQFNNANNSDTFKQQLAKQTGEVAKTALVKTDINPELSWALVHILIDMNRAETVPGLLAGLKNMRPDPRALSARALVSLRRSIVTNDTLFAQTVAGLREAALVETSSVALGRIYAALAYPGKVGDVFDAYTATFEKRMAFRRQPGINADGAELAAWEYFRSNGVAQSLDAAQKAKLVGQIAVFMRIDAERYAKDDLSFDEIDQIERAMDGAEAVLTAIGATGGGNVRGALAAGGHSGRTAVVQEVWRWVGDAATNQSGALNAAPWNVPVGAP